MQPGPQLLPANQVFQPGLSIAQPTTAASSKPLPDAAGFVDHLAKAVAATVAMPGPVAGTVPSSPSGVSVAAPGAAAQSGLQQQQVAAQIAAVEVPAVPIVPAQNLPPQVASVKDAPGQDAPVQDAAAPLNPDPDQAAPVPAIGVLSLPMAVLGRQPSNGVAQVPRAIHSVRGEPKVSTTPMKTEDTTATDPPDTMATQPLPLALPLPVDVLPQVQPGPANDADAGDTKGTLSVAAPAVGHLPGAKPSVHSATAPDALPAGTLVTPHPAEVLHASTQSASEKPDAGQSPTTQAMLPTLTTPALHPSTADAAPVVSPANTAPPPAASVHAVSPADQIAPALVSMGHAPDGAQRLTMRLAPPELGQVQIRIDRPPDAAARVDITVEKAETLTLLLRDQPQLQRALDQAGVPPEGRSVTFHVVAPEPVSRVDVLPVPPSSGATSNGLAGEYSQGASHQDSQPAQQQTSAEGADEAAQTDIAPPPWTRWLRVGLDITA